MMRRRKNSNGKLVAAAALVLAAVAAFLIAVPARMPKPETTAPQLVPEGAFAGRRNIYDRRLRELAVSLRLTSVYARPLELRDSEMVAGELAAILKRDERELLGALRSERSFAWLARRLEADQAERIADLEAKGLYFYEEEQRFYPQHETAAHVLGYLSNDQGLAGIEFQYEQILQGGLGRQLPPELKAASVVNGEQGGANLVLTLDLDLQSWLERELAQVRRATKAAAAMALVMEPASGEVHALVNLPAFDPNRFWKYPSPARRNRVLTDAVYPGGLWNLFRLAAAIDAGHPAAAGEEEVPFLVPRRRKAAEGEGSQLHPDWAGLENGIYASPALVGLPELPPEGDVGRLLRALDMAGESGIDLPVEHENGRAAVLATSPDLRGNGDAVAAIQLLAAFNRLVSVGGTAPPHLLKSLWPSAGEPVAVAYEKKVPALNKAASEAVVSVLREGEPAAGGLAESVFDTHLLRPLSETEEKGDTADSCRQQDVLLGIGRGESPCTFLLVLDGACIDPSRPSLLRHTGRRLQKWLASPPAKAAAPAPAADKPPEEVYKQWRQVQKVAAPPEDKAVLAAAARMPDVKGHALRQALQELQAYGIPLEVAGSGRVVGQEPKAGTPLTDVGVIRLELKAR